MKYKGQFSTFKKFVQNIEPHITYSADFSTADGNDILATLNKVSELLADLGINPDRHYSISEIGDMKQAIAAVLVGEVG